LLLAADKMFCNQNHGQRTLTKVAFFWLRGNERERTPNKYSRLQEFLPPEILHDVKFEEQAAKISEAA
jgi:hypothetical protein